MFHMFCDEFLNPKQWLGDCHTKSNIADVLYNLGLQHYVENPEVTETSSCSCRFQYIGPAAQLVNSGKNENVTYLNSKYIFV